MLKEAVQIKEVLARFSAGTSSDAYRVMGCHREVRDGQEGFVFRVWAPHARSVQVLGRFNDWNKDAPLMELIGPGIWERFEPEAKDYDEYKFYIQRPDGTYGFKSDP